MEHKVFGELTVISYSHNDKYQNKLWNCKCSCGKLAIVSTANLNKGHTKSCGCKQYRSGKDVYNYTGYEDITGAKWYSIQENAKVRKLEFLITKEEVWNIYLNQNRKCALSGISISFKDKTASIDRKDNTKGYRLSNIWLVHKDINLMRNKFTIQHFKEMCKAVSDQTEVEKLLIQKGIL